MSVKLLSSSHNPPYNCQSLEEFFDYVSPLSKLALQTRQLIKETLPSSEEVIKWGVPFYKNQKNICYLSYKKLNKQYSLLLGLYSGHLMFDNHKLFLNTSHSQIRYILINDWNSKLQDLIRSYLLQAQDIAASLANTDDIHR